MIIVCKNLNLHENSYECMGGWTVYTYDLDYKFEYANDVVIRKIRWKRDEIMSPKRLFSNENKLIKAIIKDVKQYFKESKIDMKNEKYNAEVNELMKNFNDKKEIIIKI